MKTEIVTWSKSVIATEQLRSGGAVDVLRPLPVMVGRRRFEIDRPGQPNQQLQQMRNQFRSYTVLPQTADKMALFCNYAECSGKLDKVAQEIKGFMEAVFVCNGHNDTNVKLPALEPPSIMQIAGLPAERAIDHLEDLLRVKLEGAFIWFAKLLDMAAHSNLIGLVEVSKDDPRVCSFAYTRRKDERTEQERNGKLHVKVKSTLYAHLHDLIGAASHPFPSHSIVKPGRINGFIYKTPAWMQPQLRIVTGQKIHEWIFSKDFGSTEWMEDIPPRSTWAGDPAICLGRYALAGFDEEEIAEEDHMVMPHVQQLIRTFSNDARGWGPGWGPSYRYEVMYRKSLEECLEIYQRQRAEHLADNKAISPLHRLAIPALQQELEKLKAAGH